MDNHSGVRLQSHRHDVAARRGQQTLSENIADLAGRTTAYDVFHVSLGGKAGAGGSPAHGRSAVVPELGADLAQHVSGSRAPTNVVDEWHSPGEWRAVTMRNLDAWYPAFAAKPGEKLYPPPAGRVRIW